MVIGRTDAIDSVPLLAQQRKRYPKYTEKPISLKRKPQNRASRVFPLKNFKPYPGIRKNQMDGTDDQLKNGHHMPKGWKYGNSLGIKSAYHKTDDDKHQQNEFKPDKLKGTSKELLSQIPKPSQTLSSRTTNFSPNLERSPNTKIEKVRTSWRDDPMGYSGPETDFENDYFLGQGTGSPSPVSRIKSKVHKENIPLVTTYPTGKTSYVTQNPVSKHQRDEMKLKMFSAHSNPFPMKKRELNLFKKTNDNSGPYENFLEDPGNLDQKLEHQYNTSHNQEFKPQRYIGLLRNNPEDSQKISSEVEEIEAEYRSSCIDTLKPSVTISSNFESSSSVYPKDREVTNHDSLSVYENSSEPQTGIPSTRIPTIKTYERRPNSSQGSSNSQGKSTPISRTHCRSVGDMNGSKELGDVTNTLSGKLHEAREQLISQNNIPLEPVTPPLHTVDVSTQKSSIKSTKLSPSPRIAESTSSKLQDRPMQSFSPKKIYPLEIISTEDSAKGKYTNSGTDGIYETYLESELIKQNSTSFEPPTEKNGSEAPGQLVSRPKSDIDPVERITAEANLFEFHSEVNKSISDNIDLTSLVQPQHTCQDKRKKRSRPNVELLPIETPRITGAFIETPVPSRSFEKKLPKIPYRRAVSLEDLDLKKESRASPQLFNLPIKSSSRLTYQQESTLPQIRPTLINTAQRTTLSEDIRLIKSEENIEDSDTDFFEAAKEEIGLGKKKVADNFMDLEYKKPNLHFNVESKGQRPDQSMIESMNRKLKNASHSIHDAQQGIERLEKQVSSSSITQDVRVSYDNYQKLFRLPRLYINVPLPRPEQPSGLFQNRNWQLTWFGLIFLCLSVWFITELTFCDVYCHPKYSSENKWHPSDPFFPYAIPTKVDQWSGRLFSRSIKRIFNQWDSAKFAQQRRPKQPYSGYDWWVGEPGPAPIFIPESFDEGDDLIDNDEILE